MRAPGRYGSGRRRAAITESEGAATRPESPLRASLRGLAGRAGEYLDRYHRTAPSYLLDRQDKLLAAGITLFFFLLYLYTCSHRVNVAGDSPELIGVSYSLGIAHPPGYPLYTLLGYLFTHIPVGSVAFRLNFASTLYHSLAILFLFLALIKVTRSRAAACIAAAALGFSSLFWFYSLMAEVFPLNDLFCALLIYVAIRVRERWVDGDREGSERLFLLLAFLSGLSLTHHHTILFVFPTLLLFVLYPLLSVAGKPKRLALGALLFLAGLLPYLYLPVRAAQNPYLNFADPSTFKSFLEVVTRRYYGSSRLWVGPAAVHRLDLVFDYAKTLGREVHLYGLVLGAVGMFSMARKRFGDFLPLFVGLLLTGALFPFMANVELRGAFDISTIERFYLLPTVFFAFFIAMGVGTVTGWLKSLLARLKVREDLKRGLSWVIVLLLALPFLLPAGATSADVNLKYDELGEAYLANLLASVEEGALVFLDGDIPTQLTQYHQTVVAGGKEIVALIYPYMLYPWYVETVRVHYPQLRLPADGETPQEALSGYSRYMAWLIDYIVANNPQIPGVYFTAEHPELEGTVQLVPWGMAFKRIPAGEEIDPAEYLGFLQRYWKGFDYSGCEGSLYSSDSSESALLSLVSLFPAKQGELLADMGDPRAAVFMCATAYDIAPLPRYLLEIARLYLRQGDGAMAYRYLTYFVDSVSVYDTELWKAMLLEEEILAGTGEGHEQ